MNNTSRRRFLATSSKLCLFPLTFHVNADTLAEPRLLLHIFANGGWDVASFCDPKGNTSTKINTWAEKQNIEKIGSFSFAPIAENRHFFENHSDKMLVINGINSQTNVHSAGRLSSMTGYGKKGYAGISALHAANHSSNLSMPLLGNSFETGNIIAPTQINGGLLQALSPSNPGDSAHLLPHENQLLQESLQLRQPIIPESNSKHYLTAVSNHTKDLSQISRIHRSLASPANTDATISNDIKLIMAAFATGASVACDYSIFGFDTHDNHDQNSIKPLTNLTQAANAAWKFAEDLNIANRLTVIISSEFGRTPFYNDVYGKDHWPYQSLIIMKLNADWKNRVIGATNDSLIGERIDPTTLAPSPQGIHITMGHIHASLRKHLAISDTLNNMFPIPNEKPINILL
jgi:hypothetical protein